jgi:sulfatase modifying factor 1
MKSNKLILTGAVLAGSLFLGACSQKSSKTGWNYNDPKNGGFEVVKYKEQQTGPGLVLIQGGTFVMGATEQNIAHDYDNISRRVTVASFYMDESEVSNIDWLEYTYWLSRVFGETYPEVYDAALPDTTVWRRDLGFNEPFVDNYLRHPAYQKYPVVGVSWKQANDYCVWRTDRVNEQILVDRGYIKANPNQYGEENFNTGAYYAGLYQPEVRKARKDLNPNSDTRNIRPEDGIMLPAYRLPTEAEWEYAAQGLIGNSDRENISDRRLYPWNGHGVRYAKGKAQGEIQANFKRGRGDYMGVANRLNDNAAPTAPVKYYWPNDYGLYNIAGNVNEWTADIYRPMTYTDAEDFNTFRGNVYTLPKKDADGYMEKDSLGRVSTELDFKRYSNPNVIDYLDSLAMYNERNSLISNQTRVYKGGSWRDLPYWLNPGTRRYLDENMSRDDIGFRCAMTRVGSPGGKKR